MIPITKAVFDQEDFDLIQEPLRSGWVVQGKFVQQFESLFCEFTRAAHSIATTSCTTSLHIAMAALKIGHGDEVIVPSFTWIASANCVEYVGAKPVFVDIQLDTFNIDPDLIEAAITPRTRAIVVVHLFGLCADMSRITEIAKKHGLAIVEDAACGFDSWYRGQHAGTFGEYGCFSFHPRKSITTGEGGMITTSNASDAALCRTLRDHGASRTDFERHTQQQSFLLASYQHLGFNFRMTDLQGALGVAQMHKAGKIMAQRRAAGEAYDKLLSNVAGLQLPFRHPDYIHGQQSYVCLYSPETPTLENVDELSERRNHLMITLENQGISTRQGTHAAALTDYYKDKYGIRPNDFPNAYIAEKLSLTLPLFAGITEAEQLLVTESLLPLI